MNATRIALVTGANKGIGFEVTKTLARYGHRVLLGARNPGLGERAAKALQAEGLDVSFLELDLDQPESIGRAAALIERDHGHLDILVNNAGVAAPGSGDDAPSVAALDVVRRIMDTNFLGTLAVTQALLPLIRRSSAGRIVNVSSGLGSIAFNLAPTWPFATQKLLGYSCSKVALNMLTIQLANELAGTSIKVNAADPGYTATDMTGHQGIQTLAEGAVAIVRLALLNADGPTGGFFNAAGPRPW